MFEFTFENFPRQELVVETAEISLFAHVPSSSDKIALYVKVSAAPRDLPSPEGEDSRMIAPTFYTEWLEIPLDALKSRQVDLLDGYRMAYDFATEQEDGFDQHPGAVYQDSHAAFDKATMVLTHKGGLTYRVQAEGKTEFGWTFRIDTDAVLKNVAAKSGRENGDKTPSDEVSDWFGKHFDAAQFSPVWSRKGSDEFNWQVLEATPSAK